MKPKPNILIYADEGAGPLSLQCTQTSFHNENLDTLLIKREYLLDQPWESDTQLLVIPGGRDIPYHNAMQGIINERVRKFVENGGSYLGLCAGAYYGCAKIEFEVGGKLEVIGNRELGFFPGIARGPAYGPNTFKYNSEAGAKIARLTGVVGSESASYYNGGCEFVDADKYEGVRVIARYDDIAGKPAAIVECAVGRGRVVLCGVHPEYSYADLKPKHPLYEELKLAELKRVVLWRSLLERLIK